jgi:hypothetical protein
MELDNVANIFVLVFPFLLPSEKKKDVGFIVTSSPSSMPPQEDTLDLSSASNGSKEWFYLIHLITGNMYSTITVEHPKNPCF